MHDRDDDEASRHYKRRNPEGRLASPPLRKQDDVRSASYELLRAEQTSDEEVLGTSTDQDLEELRCEVSEGCHSS